MAEIQAYKCSNIISYFLKLAWQLPSGTSFDHVMATACIQTITLLYIYLCIWGLDLRLNNVNYSCWYFSSSFNHYILILNLWNTIKFKYHNQWVSYLWYSLLHWNCTKLHIKFISISNKVWFFNITIWISLWINWMHCLKGWTIVIAYMAQARISSSMNNERTGIQRKGI